MSDDDRGKLTILALIAAICFCLFMVDREARIGKERQVEQTKEALAEVLAGKIVQEDIYRDLSGNYLAVWTTSDGLRCATATQDEQIKGLDCDWGTRE